MSVCLLFIGVSTTHAAIGLSSSQTTTSSQLSNKWEQAKTAVNSRVTNLTNQVTSHSFWSRVGETIKSYWYQLVGTVKGWFGSSS